MKKSSVKPLIARDTGEPLVVMGHYPVAEDGGILRQYIAPKINPKPENPEPVNEDPPRLAEDAYHKRACQVRTKVGRENGQWVYRWLSGVVDRVHNDGELFEIFIDGRNFTTRVSSEDVKLED